MAARHWSIQNYNAFLGRARAEYGVSHQQAQAMYREMRDTLGRAVRGVDVERHPRLADSAARAAVGAVAAAPAFGSYAQFADAMEFYGEEYDLIDYDVEGTADYGETD